MFSRSILSAFDSPYVRSTPLEVLSALKLPAVLIKLVFAKLPLIYDAPKLPKEYEPPKVTNEPPVSNSYSNSWKLDVINEVVIKLNEAERRLNEVVVNEEDSKKNEVLKAADEPVYIDAASNDEPPKDDIS